MFVKRLSQVRYASIRVCANMRSWLVHHTADDHKRAALCLMRVIALLFWVDSIFRSQTSVVLATSLQQHAWFLCLDSEISCALLQTQRNRLAYKLHNTSKSNETSGSVILGHVLSKKYFRRRKFDGWRSSLFHFSSLRSSSTTPELLLVICSRTLLCWNSTDNVGSRDLSSGKTQVLANVLQRKETVSS